SYLSQPPGVWFVVCGLAIAWPLWKLPKLRWITLASFLICAVLAEFGPGGGAENYWSPYQKLTLRPVRKGDKIVAYDLETNGAWYQEIMNLSSAAVSPPGSADNDKARFNTYNLPFLLYPHPPTVLVLGAGTGNDVAAALLNGAGRVTAVEIDPVILRLGERLHFDHPYSSPRVQLVVDDARSYVQNSRGRFDLIIFSLLDSHITNNYYSNIRIDNYVYTAEAMRAAMRLLKPDGLIIVRFAAETPWIAGRLRGLLSAAFGRSPVYFGDVGRVFVAGSEKRIKQALANPMVAAYVASHRTTIEPAPLTTDDWPYFYQRAPGLPASIVLISVVIVLMCWLFMRKTGAELHSIRWHFFFLGAGFMLLETQIVSRMALLFGTTWMVNSVVIAGVMIFIVCANLLVEWKPLTPVGAAYAGIFVSIAAAFAIPLESFFFSSFWMKALAATVVLCLPVFFAGIVFIRSFAAARFGGMALGSNLIGAVIGGLLESLSLWTGIRSLLVVAAVLYAASWVAMKKQAAIEEDSRPEDGIANDRARSLTTQIVN
ncbi:MAG TPA: methyltransferase, partial [Candidatus Binataceae bacterium]|nr:methyltransferase [Candidatus Binataceae bacterium]